MIGKRVRERFSRSLTSVTLDDILSYIRYIAGEVRTDVELPGSFFVYISRVHLAKKTG
jgi:hypothetical protein